MNDNVTAWPKATGAHKQPPIRIKRACDWGLESAVSALETQLGTIEAYNRIVDAANILKSRIDTGDVKAQNPLYAKNIKG